MSRVPPSCLCQRVNPFVARHRRHPQTRHRSPRRQGRPNGRDVHSNEGRKGRYIIGHDGRRHPVFITASRNLGSDTGKPMSGWHSINPRNADTSRFGAYILSVEDELRKPVFFIFTPEEFQPLLDSKKADSKGLRHFYISRAEAGIDRFVDWRDGGMDMTQYRGAFNKLEFNA